jgi:hypothetical protein
MENKPYNAIIYSDDKNLGRDIPEDVTYSLELVLAYLSRRQIVALNEFLDKLESNGVETVSYKEVKDEQ